jgi:hypothetical protein
MAAVFRGRGDDLQAHRPKYGELRLSRALTINSAIRIPQSTFEGASMFFVKPKKRFPGSARAHVRSGIFRSAISTFDLKFIYAQYVS